MKSEYLANKKTEDPTAKQSENEAALKRAKSSLDLAAANAAAGDGGEGGEEEAPDDDAEVDGEAGKDDVD